MSVLLKNIVKIQEEVYAGSLTTFAYEFFDNDGDAKDLTGFTPKLYMHSSGGVFIASQAYDEADSTLTTGNVEFDVTIPSTAGQYGAIVTIINGSDLTTFTTMSVRRIDILSHSLATS